MTQKTFADMFREEAKRFNNVVYFSKPYSCALEEACSWAENYVYPTNATITREEKQTTISIPPAKGSRKRKPFVVNIWIS